MKRRKIVERIGYPAGFFRKGRAPMQRPDLVSGTEAFASEHLIALSGDAVVAFICNGFIEGIESRFPIQQTLCR